MDERAYYNENDEFAAAWLKAVIAKGLVAPGEVDTRSIVDVRPDDLTGFRQHHFFAGIGVWSYALRCAGWPDARPIWTGSCPCQPFSGAGKGDGFADERHLWPAFFHLIEQCEPRVVLGEQVASPDGLAWLDLVQTDMENAAFSFAAIDLCAAGFGAPHIRQRLYWLAYAEGGGSGAGLRDYGSPGFRRSQSPDLGATRILVDGVGARLEGHGRNVGDRDQSGRIDANATGSTPATGAARELAHTDGGHAGTGPVNGLWRDADWLFCRDGKWRPVEPGTFPLAHGVASRVGRLRGYGNAIVAPVAQAFIEAVMEVIP